MMDGGKVSAAGLSPDCPSACLDECANSPLPVIWNVTSILLGIFSLSVSLYQHVKCMTALVQSNTVSDTSPRHGHEVFSLPTAGTRLTVPGPLTESFCSYSCSGASSSGQALGLQGVSWHGEKFLKDGVTQVSLSRVLLLLLPFCSGVNLHHAVLQSCNVSFASSSSYLCCSSCCFKRTSDGRSRL
jgi:hypothetical protein